MALLRWQSRDDSEGVLDALDRLDGCEGLDASREGTVSFEADGVDLADIEAAEGEDDAGGVLAVAAEDDGCAVFVRGGCEVPGECCADAFPCCVVADETGRCAVASDDDRVHGTDGTSCVCEVRDVGLGGLERWVDVCSAEVRLKTECFD